jgi:hypothetical protein
LFEGFVLETGAAQQELVTRGISKSVEGIVTNYVKSADDEVMLNFAVRCLIFMSQVSWRQDPKKWRSIEEVLQAFGRIVETIAKIESDDDRKRGRQDSFDWFLSLNQNNGFVLEFEYALSNLPQFEYEGVAMQVEAAMRVAECYISVVFVAANQLSPQCLVGKQTDKIIENVMYLIGRVQKLPHASYEETRLDHCKEFMTKQLQRLPANLASVCALLPGSEYHRKLRRWLVDFAVTAAENRKWNEVGEVCECCLAVAERALSADPKNSWEDVAGHIYTAIVIAGLDRTINAPGYMYEKLKAGLWELYIASCRDNTVLEEPLRLGVEGFRKQTFISLPTELAEKIIEMARSDLFYPYSSQC